jgi:hypothetical protein
MPGELIMPSSVALPAPNAIGQLIGMLADKPVKVAKAAGVKKPEYVALYVDDDGKDTYACYVERTLIASMGASLALIPAGVVTDALKATAPLSELFVSNAYEVLNVMAACFNESHPRHVRIRGLWLVKDAPAHTVKSTAVRAEHDVTVANYAAGRLSVATLD